MTYSPCRICGRPSQCWNDDNTANRDHDVCDEIVREQSRPTLVPPGMSLREFHAMRDADARREYIARTQP